MITDAASPASYASTEANHASNSLVNDPPSDYAMALTGKPIAQVARDLGIKDGTLANWVALERRRRENGAVGLGEDERAELARLRRENAELRVRCDVLKRSLALWVEDSVGR